MKNITLAVEDDVLEKARIVAAERRTTVNAMVRDFLTEIATRDDKLDKARRDLLELIDNSTGDMGPDWRWNRDEIYER
jgi:hypothetical protein